MEQQFYFFNSEFDTNVTQKQSLFSEYKENFILKK